MHIDGQPFGTTPVKLRALPGALRVFAPKHPVSGHSAAAFAGAILLAREYPGAARGFFGLAALVAFSRIYLGAHYPGDVVSGSLLGTVLARIYSRLLRKIGDALV